jgi:hypothetical protein
VGPTGPTGSVGSIGPQGNAVTGNANIYWISFGTRNGPIT